MDFDLNYANQFLGLLVKQAREEKEWDQEYLADELGIDIRTVRKIESGQSNVAYDLLSKIIHALEICPQILFYVDEAEKGMKMDRLYRGLLSCLWRTSRWLPNPPIRAGGGLITKQPIQRKRSRSVRVSRFATPFGCEIEMLLRQ